MTDSSLLHESAECGGESVRDPDSPVELREHASVILVIGTELQFLARLFGPMSANASTVTFARLTLRRLFAVFGGLKFVFFLAPTEAFLSAHTKL